MTATPSELDAMLNFVVREKRFLRPSETSYPLAKLKRGETLTRQIVRALDKANGGGAKAALKELPTPITRSHVALVQQHHQVFKSALTANSRNGKKPKPKSSHIDMFYIPRDHEYK
jgi:hypothetical protein